MGERIRKLKKIRIHHEGTNTLVYSLVTILAIAYLLWEWCPSKWPLCVFLGITLTAWFIVLNFYRCPIRYFNKETERVVVAPADGKVVVIEEVEENTYFHERRLMVSIFMSLFNVHANWIPVDGTVKIVRHQDGNFHRAWLPKASEENERSMVIITTPDGTDIMVRQVAGAMARRIVTYAREGEECYVDEHLGFIKFGSRVDLYLPLNSDVLVSLGQKTVGNETIIARLNPIVP